MPVTMIFFIPPPTRIVERQLRRNGGNAFVAPHNGARDNLATMLLYTKLAVRLRATYGRGHQVQGTFKTCVRSIAGRCWPEHRPWRCRSMRRPGAKALGNLHAERTRPSL